MGGERLQNGRGGHLKFYPYKKGGKFFLAILKGVRIKFSLFKRGT